MAPPASVEIVSASPGHIAVRGPLIFATACRAHEAGLEIIAGSEAGEIAVDCAGVNDSDSAGLVVLLDWLARARQRGLSIRFANVPDTLFAVARISEVEALLGAGV